jgi:hypothetical protein
MKVLWRTASACLFSTEDSLAESAESITHYEAAARAMASKLWQAPENHPVSAARAYSAGLNPEL